MKCLVAIALTSIFVLSLESSAAAKTVVVEMKNFRAGVGAMVFDPPYVQVQPGDTVVFKASDKGHDVASIPTFAPSGTATVAGKMNQDQAVVLAKPGLYGFKCTPHYSMGMVALVKVGTGKSAAPASVVAAMPPLAKKRMTALVGLAN